MKLIIPVAIVASAVLAALLGWYGGTSGALWGAVLIVVTAGGSIAYLGDIIGYSLGKKRVSLMGLRPRDTAKLIGVGAGAVSALAAGIFLVAIDQEFRIALSTGHQLAHKLLELRVQNSQLERKIETSSATLRGAEMEKDRAVRDERAAEDARARAVADRDTARKELAGAQTDVARTKAELALRQRDLDKADKAIAVLEQRSKDLQQRNKIAQAEYNAIENKIYHEANPIIAEARSGDLVYRNGQEVGRGIVRNGSKAELVRSLDALLDTLSQKAESAGAGRAGNKRAVKLAWIQLRRTSRTRSGADDPNFVDEAGLLDALADQIRASNTDSVVVIATSVGNTFEKTPAILQLHPYRNHLVVRAGTVLAETTMHNDGALDPADVAMRMQRLLVDKVRPAAMQAGVIPVLESSHSDAQLGNLPLSDLLNVVISVEAIRGDSTVSAIALKDIWSGDQLQLRFAVRPASTAASGSGAAGS